MKECDINNFIQSSALVQVLAKLPQQQPEPLICNCFIIRVTNTRLYPSFSHPDFSSPVGLGASSNPKFSLRGVNGRRQRLQPRASRCYGNTSHFPGDRVASTTLGRAASGTSNCLRAAAPKKAGQPWPSGDMNAQR